MNFRLFSDVTILLSDRKSAFLEKSFQYAQFERNLTISQLRIPPLNTKRLANVQKANKKKAELGSDYTENLYLVSHEKKSQSVSSREKLKLVSAKSE